MNPEIHKGRERSAINMLEEVGEKLDVVMRLTKAGFSFTDEIQEDVMDRAREIAGLDTFDNLETVKELLIIELQIQKLASGGLTHDELAEEVETDLTEVAKILLSDNAYTSNDEEAHLVLRSALKKSPDGAKFTDSLLEAVEERKAVRATI
ncbi:hypothetical protein A2Z56_02005 [Candidatus Kaiserbacteria bacterium RIFCSPHIGHO2_12_45_16]|nr:MAG: hypothetical protein A2Z56_02005 [Candidatus Kaiserbacteria bacterium RIFCSPHIGHO2_12_45_16]